MAAGTFSLYSATYPEKFNRRRNVEDGNTRDKKKKKKKKSTKDKKKQPEVD